MWPPDSSLPTWPPDSSLLMWPPDSSLPTWPPDSSLPTWPPDSSLPTWPPDSSLPVKLSTPEGRASMTTRQHSACQAKHLRRQGQRDNLQHLSPLWRAACPAASDQTWPCGPPRRKGCRGRSPADGLGSRHPGPESETQFVWLQCRAILQSFEAKLLGLSVSQSYLTNRASAEVSK